MKNRKEIIEIVYQDILSGRQVFMCNAIERYLENKEKVFKIFPELLKYKPKNKSNDSAWWYGDEEGKQKRLEVLTSLINELND